MSARFIIPPAVLLECEIVVLYSYLAKGTSNCIQLQPSSLYVDSKGAVHGKGPCILFSVLTPYLVLFACRALSSVGSISLIKFTSVTNAFGNFTDSKDYTKFFNRVKHYGCVWCCVNAHPGHILYDFWWDIPHTDVVGRKWDKWEPKPGP
jgi:hypothetical protein